MMRRTLVVFLCSSIGMVALAQQPAATPKKDPFADFGRTGLDQRPGGLSTGGLSRPPLPSSLPPGSPSTATVIAPDPSGNGIVVSSNWTAHTAESSGGQTMKIDDLNVIMSKYGKPEADLAPHPNMLVYEGPVAGGGPNETCQIPYLMPLDRAEATLMKSRGLSTAARAVMPGQPDGLFLHTYDIHLGIYNRLCLVTDGKRPMQQVVALLLKSESGTGTFPMPPWVVLNRPNRDWHTIDYVNTENRAMAMAIQTLVSDQRGHGYIIVTTGKRTNLPNVVVHPNTWYVPQPMIKLINYCIAQLQGSGGGPATPQP